MKKDKIRQKNLESLGVSFIRFDDKDVKTRLNEVVDIIDHWIMDNQKKLDSLPNHLPINHVFVTELKLHSIL